MMPAAPDQSQRDAAVRERARNVLIDAGAGTGKTTIVVERLVDMVAPADGSRAVPIDRVAAITFTRKAAGELRLRIRERLLRELAGSDLAPARRAHLHGALAGLDTAYVGTIHSFADRLLRLRPVEAQLSPGYEVAEDDEALVRETYEVLLHAIQSHTLADELAGLPEAARAEEAMRFLPLALQAGLRAESREREWDTQYGLDALVAGFIAQRDVPPADPPADVPFDATAFRNAVDEFLERAAPVRGRSEGARWIQATARRLGRVADTTDPYLLLRETLRLIDSEPRDPKYGLTFQKDKAAWAAWKRYTGADGEAEPLRDALLAPVNRWFALKLVRLFPVVLALHEKVKARRRALDQLDLLARLRDLLVRDLAARGELQRLFDHIFVDEFQDTDPLQAEIVLFLCEREPRAPRWEEVELRPGSLTLVGDPKQSIYRFRRADIQMYDRVRALVARTAHLPVRLSANFRSIPRLIGWLNDRFDRVLGTDPTRPFDPDTGRVFHQRLAAGRAGESAAPVHVLPFNLPGGKRSADAYRAVEGRALAHYLRWLVERSGLQIEDAVGRQRRAVGYGDIAVLAISTMTLPYLLPALDAAGVPHASRGGRLFLVDPLHRQFLLGLRAVADRDDGVAEAALLRPPFFSVDLAELARTHAARGQETNDAGILRVREARELVRALRRHRFDRPPGATARDLLERTAFGRTVALGPNGAQRLSRLRELCLVLEQMAARDGLDYDAVTAQMRAWVDAPLQLDPPHPVATEAVQILTVHQAKGLEFPVVVLWDGMCLWRSYVQQSPWRMERDGRGWVMTLDRLKWEEPAGLDLREMEQRYLDAERRRVVYVAATRARDLLVVPRAGGAGVNQHICADLLDGADAALVHEVDAYADDAPPAWALELVPWSRREIGAAPEFEHEVAARWEAVAAAAARARFRPVGVAAAMLTGVGRATVSEEATPTEAGRATASRDATVAVVSESGDGFEAPAQKPRQGRFGSLYGTTVHRAIGIALREDGLQPAEAVRRAAAETGLTDHLEPAVADLERVIAALRTAGLFPEAGATLRIEYPLAGMLGEGELAAGYADLVAVTSSDVIVLDFKTDAPPTRAVEQAYGEYVAQARAYRQLLAAAAAVGDRRLRSGLFFTADGAIRWVE
jgi:ATP-dependent exoDNAse (exonuclease V) beta subunit